MTVYSENPERGCGKKVPGKFYAEGVSGKGGTLELLVNVLGSHTEDGTNVFVDLPPRGVTVFNPSATLLTSTMVYDDVPFDAFDPSTALKHLAGLGTVALADHVGEQYTPYSFSTELMMYGPSRAIPPKVARQIAHLLPIPIFFSHSRMPLFQSRSDLELYLKEELAEPPEEKLTYTPTWWNAGFGMRKGNYRGLDHAVVPILRHMDMNLSRKRSKYAGLKVPVVEMFFAASWINQVSYALKEGESDVPDPALRGLDGVVAIDLQEDSHAVHATN